MPHKNESVGFVLFAINEYALLFNMNYFATNVSRETLVARGVNECIHAVVQQNNGFFE